MKWNLTTKNPEKSGNYLVIPRFSLPGGKQTFGDPFFCGYSKIHDAWNCSDDSTALYKMPDLREEEKSAIVYAWAEIEAPSDEELTALGKGVA